MELDDHGFLEELLALRRDTWEGFPPEMADLFPSDCFDDANHPATVEPFGVPPPDIVVHVPNESTPVVAGGGGGGGGGGVAYCSPFDNGLNEMHCTSAAVVGGGEDVGLLQNGEEVVCKVEVGHHQPVVLGGGGGGLGFEMVSSSSTSPCCLDRKVRLRKAEGQPSKNLMAERRRRKRLNDRLSMLRSVVPKISKMDRTSILGDTIDYMKELLERIKGLQGEIETGGAGAGANSDNQQHNYRGNLLGIFKEVNPNEMLVRNTPQFDVDRRELDTRVEICCAGKPGLLLSTVSTLEALGLEIQQCVVSCFNDFGMQASCSEDVEQRAILSSDEIKQALFRNAGYGGRCM